MTVIKRTLPDLLMLLIIAVVSGWSGWEATSRIHGNGLSLSSQSHLFGLRPAALFAAGFGLGRTDCGEGGFPELDAFFQRKIAAVPCGAYPESCGEPYTRNFHFYFHYYLIAYMGWMFRLFGISVGTIHLACVLMHVTAMAALYGLFRLVMGRLLSLAGVLYVATSPVFLVLVPDFRDYGKVPFILTALCLMGYILKNARPPGRLLGLSLALGVVIGVGYGFRQDLLICMPPAAILLLFGARLSASHPWRWRMAAALTVIAAFALTALPVFRGRQESGGFILAHTLLQGISASAEGEIGFGNADYDFGFLGLDTPVIASVAAYARRTGCDYPDSYISREYGDAGTRLFREIALLFPADFAARALAAAEHAFHIPGSRFIEETMHLEPYRSNGERLRLLDAIHNPADRFFSACGPLCAVLFVFLLAAQGYRKAVWVCGLFLYFAAYPSLLAECRHLFYLAFLPAFFTGGVVSLGFGRVRAALRSRKDIPLRTFLGGGIRQTLKGLLFVVVLTAVVAASLASLRLYQHARVSRMLAAYDAARLSPIPVEKESGENTVRLRPARTLPELLGSSPPGQGQVVPAYLALRFREADRTVVVTLLNKNEAFVRPCIIRLHGSGTYFFPVCEFGAVTDAMFAGLELPAEDADLVEGLYLVENAAAFPVWPFITVPENKADFIPWKTGRIDRSLEWFNVELRAGFGLWPEKAACAYSALIRRYPFHAPFANRALAYAARSADSLLLLRTWEHIGACMPDRRAEAAVWISREADRLRERGDLTTAFLYYEAAHGVAPGALWNRVRMGEILAEEGDCEAAITAFRYVLERAPESPYTANLLNDLFIKCRNAEEAVSFWEVLVEAHPETATPLLYLGASLERAGNVEAAHDAYTQSLKIRPGHAPALFRLGALEAVRGHVARGIELMRDARQRDPGLASRISESCAGAAARVSEQGRYEDALLLNHTAVELFPDNLRPRAQLGALLETEGKFDAALEHYLAVLKKAPESPDTARRLDALTRRMGWNAEQRAQLWRTLADDHPDAREPAAYLRKNNAESQDQAENAGP